MLSLVLSLKRDEERREKFFQQPDAKSFHVFYAIDAKTEKGKECILNYFDFEQAKQLYYREITLGEAACTLSHLLMYRYFLEYSQEDYLIVCEDDAVFSPDYPILHQIIQQQSEFDIILFGESKTNCYQKAWDYPFIQPIQQIDRYKLGQLHFDYTAGTVGYVVSRRFIENILKQNFVYWLADDFQIMIDKITTEKEKFNLGYLYPKLVLEDPENRSNLEQERLLAQKKNENCISEFYRYRSEKFLKKISIIIPIYKAEDFIEFTLESCIHQTYKNIEVILVDDGCIDNSLKLIQPYLTDPRIKLIHHQYNQGTFLARKTGILAATGDNILFLDADDILLLNACEELIKFADNDLVLFRIYYERYRRHNPMRYSYNLNDSITKFFMNNRLHIDYSSAGKLYKRELLQKTILELDFIQTKFTLAEDAVLFLAAIQKINSIYFHQKTLYFYRFNLNSETVKDNLDDKLKQYSLALSYILLIKNKQDNPQLKKVCDLFYLHMVKDSYRMKLGVERYRHRLNRFFMRLLKNINLPYLSLK
ncbi:hypothetical protein CEP48_00945 [Mergibacter septicus]|uniref:Glycosyltransferase n=1 Tax=Mergibacter septicus TaxID=221402 RepID=A0A8D4IWS4_9PAST|nr:glycosyltransferase [Mergibacter septicus]AWX14829.1 hypothetical protein CEP47_00945 [Mergibacter septicus]QDJ14081.1 hypothetical protein CEP48_00945 [Mergibacter septicus]UTU48470.1 glycosyltransferase [Mergibacter septicus]WMR95901.1 glycosyltransferase [Mergibacter septicus]